MLPGVRRASSAGRFVLVGACAAAMALSAARALGGSVPGWALALAAATVLLTVAAGVFLLPSGVFGRPVLAGPADRPLVALTFDDGPDPVETRRVLDLLDARGQRATFFVIGAIAERHPELVVEIARRGHLLANHSDEHSYLTPTRSPRRLGAELARAQARLELASGKRPRWFRPPVGLLSPPVVEAARLAGVELVGWTATARDGTARATVGSALARLRPSLVPGAILVLHDAVERGQRRPIAADVLAPLLDELSARGLRSVTLDELLLGPADAQSSRPSPTESAA